MKPALVYVCKESSRTPDEGPYFAEVIADAGDDDETVLYTTSFYTAPHPAINDAEDWMRKNGVPEAEL